MAVDVETLIGRRWPDLRRQARAYAASAPPDGFEHAVEWYGHDAWEVRYVAVLVLGDLAARDLRAFDYLFERCGDDPSWQVNEALAMAFDAYCAATGYEQALATIERWLRAPHANLRRAVSEGLRPWTARGRAYFVAHPSLAVELLGRLKDDESRYVLESAGNALRDISRAHVELVLSALQSWLAERPESRSRRIVARFALELAVKKDPGLRRLYE